jgi:acyl-CoA reductase-like NAD-dependent aldehyde dehydrogenase
LAGTVGLTMGNAVVLKPAVLASLTSLAVARIAHEAGLPRCI